MSDYYAPAESVLPLFAAPAQQHSVTSRAAADSMDRATLNRLQRLIYDFVADQPGGATDEEIARACSLNPSTARPRRIELERRGLVGGWRRCGKQRRRRVDVRPRLVNDRKTERTEADGFHH